MAAYRAALEVRTHERFPHHWAVTQAHLGSALWTLGDREGGTTRLKQALAAYDAALAVFVPPDRYVGICCANRDGVIELLDQRG